MVAEFKPRLDITSKPRNYFTSWEPWFIFSDSLKLRTKVLLGALAQIGLSTILPTRWAVVPACVMLLNSIVTTVFQALSQKDNVFMEGVIPGRTTSQLPSRDGTFGKEPADKDLVVFQLGIQINHPLGSLAPGLRQIGDYYQKMEAELLERRDELGLLGVSRWRGAERESNSTLLMTFYFWDVESIHKFAHEELHRDGYNFYNKNKLEHIGVFHETFVVPAKNYETVYDHCRPVLMGQTAVKLDGGKDGQQEWAAPLVSADHPHLKTQYARMDRLETGVRKE